MVHAKNFFKKGNIESLDNESKIDSLKSWIKLINSWQDWSRKQKKEINKPEEWERGALILDTPGSKKLVKKNNNLRSKDMQAGNWQIPIKNAMCQTWCKKKMIT